MPAENQVQLASAVGKAGFTIPTATETTPLSIPATVDLVDPQLTITNTAQSAVVINFVGKKV